MIHFFYEVLYRPLLNLTIFAYNIIPGHDFGLAVIGLTLFIRILFVPLSIQTIKFSALGPKINEIREKFKNDRNAQTQAMLELYKQHKVNPLLAGCLPFIVQIPVVIALYKAFRTVAQTANLKPILYNFIADPGTIHKVFLGFVDLTQASHVMSVIAGILQFVQAKIMSQGQQTSVAPEMQMMTKQMLYFFPVMVVLFTWKLPASLTIYWIATTVFSIFEQLIIRKRIYAKL